MKFETATSRSGSSTAPHFPLQAPPEDVARYRKTYLAGWDAMRQQRWERLQALHIRGASLSATERDVGPPYAFPDAIKKLGPNELNRPLEWASLTPAQRAFQADKMAVHAAMVDRMDREIGRVLGQVKAMGALDNTLVFFLSDSGASAEIMVRGDGHDPHAECGTGATFLSIGPGWSSLANTPFRRHKTWVHEGGISTPLIVHWPKGIASRGELRHTPGHVVDLVPTILEAAGGRPPDRWDGKPVPPPPGKSLVPLFAKNGTVSHETLWWLHEGNRALRAGDWKIVAAGKDAPWELYDLASDRSETKDLAGSRPEKVRVAVPAGRYLTRAGAVLLDSARDAAAHPLPLTGRLTALSLTARVTADAVGPNLTILVFAGDLTGPRARARVADLLRAGRRPLNVRRDAGQEVRLVVDDPDGRWKGGVPAREIVLGWED